MHGRTGWRRGAWAAMAICIGCGGDAKTGPDAATDLDAAIDAAIDAMDAGPLVCELGLADCNGDAADGCEVDITRSEIQCGGCATTPCVGTEVCIASACGVPTGGIGWVFTAGTTDLDTGFAVAIDPNGGVVLAGITRGAIDVGGGTLPAAGGQGSFLASYAADGTHRWSRVLVNVEVEKVGVDVAGNVYIAGDFQNTVNVGGGALATRGAVDAIVASFAPSGVHRWSHSFGASGFDSATGVAVAPDGTAWFTGTFSGATDFGNGMLTPVGTSDVFVLRYDPAGTLLDASRYGGAGGDRGRDVALDAAGDVFLVGEVGSMVDFGGGPVASAGLFIASFTSANAHRWSAALGATFNSRMGGVAVDDAGNAFAVGRSTAGFVSDGSLRIWSFSNTGTPGWSQSFGLGANTANLAAVSAGKHVYVVGSLSESINFGGSDLGGVGYSGTFIASFSSSGNHRWSHANTGLYIDAASDGVTDVYVAARLEGTLDFGDGVSRTAIGNADVAMVKYLD